MMTSSNGNIYRVTGLLCGEFTGPGQWRGALMFSLVCTWINDWVNNREAGDLRRHRGHYDVIVMFTFMILILTHTQCRDELKALHDIQALLRTLLYTANSKQKWCHINTCLTHCEPSGFQICLKVLFKSVIQNVINGVHLTCIHRVHRLCHPSIVMSHL